MRPEITRHLTNYRHYRDREPGPGGWCSTFSALCVCAVPYIVYTMCASRRESRSCVSGVDVGFDALLSLWGLGPFCVLGHDFVRLCQSVGTRNNIESWPCRPKDERGRTHVASLKLKEKSAFNVTTTIIAFIWGPPDVIKYSVARCRPFVVTLRLRSTFTSHTHTSSV